MWKPLEAFVTNTEYILYHRTSHPGAEHATTSSTAEEYMYILPLWDEGDSTGKENGTVYLHVVMRVLRAMHKNCCAHNRNRNWNWYYNTTEQSNYVSA